MMRQIKQGIRNLLYWLPTIWRDRDWDDSFLYILMERKLAKMEKFFRENGCHVRVEKDAHNMKICKCLLKRLAEQDYNKMLKLEHHQETFSEFIKAHNAGKPTITCHLIGWLGNRWYTYEDYMIGQDLDLLFKIMRKHIRGWWD